MSVRLERNIGRAAASVIASLFQGDSFRVLDVIVEIKTLANNLAARINDDGADKRSRADLAHATRGEIQGSRHHRIVKISELVHGLCRAPERRSVYSTEHPKTLTR